ncbi:MAG: hypothetical protein HQL24_06020 [Candidatus Omnitrophica bacterium]|nr:hypothetical protein [Candidatus Omnitrophota bacterium]
MKKIFYYFLFIFVFIFLPKCSFADIALGYSGTVDKQNGTISGSPPTNVITGIVTVGAGSNRMLVLGVGVEFPRTSSTITFGTCSYNGTLMTLVTSSRIASASGTNSVDAVASYYLNNPDVGTYYFSSTVSTSSGIGTVNKHSIIAISLNGVEPATAEASNSGIGTSTDVRTSLTTLTNKAWVIDVALEESSGATLTVGTAQTQVLQVAGWAVTGMSYKAVSTAGSTSMNWTINSSQAYAIVAGSFAPAQQVICLEEP